MSEQPVEVTAAGTPIVRSIGAFIGRPVVLRTLILVGLAVLWEILADVGQIRYTSKPTEILAAIGPLAVDPYVQQAVAVTVVAVALSFVIGAVVGMLIGLTLGLSQLLGVAYSPLLIIALGIPKSVFVPLLILTFGLGIEPEIAFGALLCLIAVGVNVIGGIESVEPRFYFAAHAYRASRWRLVLHIILPGGAPGIFAGLWHGIRNSFIGVVTVQLFVSDVGIGYLVRIYTNNFRIAEALAVVFVSATIVILISVAWGAMERRLTRWHRESMPA